MEVIKSLYFAVFFFSIIVCIDLYVKFKRPLLLKIYFTILVLCISFASFVYSQDVHPTYYYYYIILTKALVASAFLNIFSILYFPKFKKFIYLLSFLLIGFTLFSLYYNFQFNPDYVNQLRGQTIVIVRDEGLNVPILFKIIRVLLIGSFFMMMIYFLYMITLKFSHNNYINFRNICYFNIFIFIYTANIYFFNN